MKIKLSVLGVCIVSSICSINASNNLNHINIIEDSKVANHKNLSITNIKDVLESFGNTENLTED